LAERLATLRFAGVEGGGRKIMVIVALPAAPHEFCAPMVTWLGPGARGTAVVHDTVPPADPLCPVVAFAHVTLVTPSVVYHKQLELFSLVFSHSGAGATGLDLLQRLFTPAELLDD